MIKKDDFLKVLPKRQGFSRGKNRDVAHFALRSPPDRPVRLAVTADRIAGTISHEGATPPVGGSVARRVHEARVRRDGAGASDVARVGVIDRSVGRSAFARPVGSTEASGK